MATNPLQQYNWGATSFAADPYKVKSERQLLMEAGLWNPAWDAWADYQEPGGDGGSSMAYAAQPDFSSLNGYQIGGADFGGGNRLSDLIAPDGSVAASQPYFYDEPSMGEEFAKGAAMVGGTALGLNYALGGLGAAGGGGAAAGGYGTLGTIAPGAGALAPIGATGAGTVGSMTAGLGGLAEVGGGLGALGAAGGAAGAGGGAGWAAALDPLASAAGGGGSSGFLGSIGSALGGMSGNTLANLGQAAIGLYGQNKALDSMKDATAQSNEFNRYAFDTIRADNQPLVDMRNSVLPQIQGLLKNPGSVMNEPGNQFQFAQGQKALANGAAARGMTYSGQQGKRLQEYGQDFASTKLDDSLRRLQSVAGLGQVGNNQMNQATANYASNASGNALNLGNARGSAYIGGANLAGNALGNIFNDQQYRNLWGGGP